MYSVHDNTYNKNIYIYNIHPPWVKNRQATGFTLAVAVTQLLIYNGMGGTHGGPGEKIAHYFEFTFAPWRNSLESHWLWLTVRHGFSMALIEIDGLPFLKMGIFHGELLNNQMVNQSIGFQTPHFPNE